MRALRSIWYFYIGFILSFVLTPYMTYAVDGDYVEEGLLAETIDVTRIDYIVTIGVKGGSPLNIILPDNAGAYAVNIKDSDEATVASIDSDGNISGTSLSDGTASLTGGSLNGLMGIDATTETTIETAIDTLPNLTSVQGQTISLLGSLTVEANSILDQDYTSDSSPTFVTTKLSGLTDGNIPYMSATGFADSPFSTDGTDIIISGDLSIAGDDLFMTTNTLGAVLVGDGTNFNPVVMSEDATIAADGKVTVANDSHEHTGATLSGIDISDDTNLAGTANEIILTDDTLSLSLLKDLVTTAPLTGGTNDILIGADSDVTLALTIEKDIVAGTGLTGGADDVLPGSDADVTISHSTANGYKHIPSDGAAAQILQYSSEGTAKWITLSSDATIADGGAITVADNSHAHDTTTISGLDISADTNLAGTANEITLTDDTLSLHADITRDAEWNTEGEVETIWGVGIYTVGEKVGDADTLDTHDSTYFAVSGGAEHDGFSDYVANEHIDWTQDQGETNIHAGNYTDTDTQLTEEEVEDYAGGMVTGNTETGITVTYQDDDGTIDFVVDAETDPVFTAWDKDYDDLSNKPTIVDWTVSQAPTVIHADNYTDTNTDTQDLSLEGNTLSLVDGGSVDLSGYLDNTDAQDLSLAGNTLSLTNDATTVDLSGYLDNTDAQDLSLAVNTLSLTGDATTVDLSSYLDNTDTQDLSLVGDTLSLTDGGSVDLSGYYNSLSDLQGAVTNDFHNLGGTDVNTTYTAGGTLLDLTGTTFSLNEGTLTDTKYCTYVAGTGIVCNSEGGSGYTNLTSFVDQTAWRIFYSNTDGDITELALGSDGQYLKSNGASAAPSWATPSSHDAVTLSATLGANLLGLSTQELTLDTQAANTVFAGPTSGEAAAPSFRALGTSDIPDLSGTYLTAEVDGSTTNEIQDLSLAGNTLSLTDDATTVDLSGYLDNTNLTEEEVEDFVGGMLGGTETGLSVTYQDDTGDIDFEHSTANGYKHIPATGSSAQILQYASEGTAKWATVSGEATIADGGAITLANDALDDQYYDSESDLTALLDDDYVDEDQAFSGDVTGAYNATDITESVLGVGGTDTVFPADPGADRYLMWDDVPGELVWAAGSGGATQLSELSDVGVTTPTDKNALMADGDSWESRALVEADISDLGSYLTTVDISANTNLAGTANQITLTDDTLSTPQDIHTGASPTFAGLSLGTGELTIGSINRASGILTLEIGGTPELSIASGAILSRSQITLQGNRAISPRYTNDSNNHRGNFQWQGLQLGNNAANYIVAGNTVVGGRLVFVVNNTVDLASDPSSHNGIEALLINADGNITMADGAKLKTDKIEAFDAAGLSLFEDGGKGIFVQDSSGNVGIKTTGPDKSVEINSADGNNLRLTYNDSNGSATYYADFLTEADGGLHIDAVDDITLDPAGEDVIIDGNLVLDTNNKLISIDNAGGTPVTVAYVDASDDFYIGDGDADIMYIATGEKLYISAGDGNDTYFRDGTTTNMTIEADGDVLMAEDLTVDVVTLTEGQIVFPATQNPSARANTLDDYEEGTYNPTVTCSLSGGFTLDTNRNTLAITKWGKVVHVQGYLETTSDDSCNGTIRISAPYTAADLADTAGSSVGLSVLSGHGGSIPNGTGANISDNVSYITLTTVSDAGVLGNLTQTEVDDAWNLSFSLTYTAAN